MGWKWSKVVVKSTFAEIRVLKLMEAVLKSIKKFITDTIYYSDKNV